MSKALTEQKVLKKLGIPVFRHMTKDKVIKFATMLHRIDPEVAKKALEQFPEFAASSKEIVSYFKETLDKSFDANNDSVQSFYKTCDNIIATLEKQLEDENLSFEEKNIIIDKMISLAEMKSAKDTENKQFLLNVAKTAGGVVLGVVIVAASLLGFQAEAAAVPTDDTDPKAWQKILCRLFSTKVKNGAVKQGGFWLNSPSLHHSRRCTAVCAPQA